VINLIVVAHPDDEILGFGGTGSILTKNHNELVQPIIMCGNAEARNNLPSNEELKNDICKANELLGFSQPVIGEFNNLRLSNVDHIDLVQFIELQIVRYRPKRIFTHHPSDLNDDHKKISHACMAASRIFQRNNEIGKLRGLYFMEILSSTDWSYLGDTASFSPNVFINIEESIDLKIQALSLYRNVMRPWPHPRSEQIIKGHSMYRGGQSNSFYAEAFQLTYQYGL